MSDVFWATYGLLWLLVALLTIMVVLIYRQFGLMWMRGSRRIGLAGLDLGSPAPPLDLERPDGHGFHVTWNENGRTASFVLFTLPTCPICRSLAETAGSLPLQRPDIEFLWIDLEAPFEAPTDEAGRRREWQVGLSPDEAAHRAMDVPAVPYAYVVAPGGAVTGKGLVNSIDDIHKLVETSLADLIGQNGQVEPAAQEETRT